MPSVLALDPGERVGWARADIGEDGKWTDLRHGIAPLKDMALALHPIDEFAPEYDVIVCEDWRLYPGMAQQFIGSAFPSVQFIGMVRLYTWLHGCQLVMQPASAKRTARKTAPEWLREKLDEPRAHDDAHDLDALLHLHHYTWVNYAGKAAA